MAVIFVKSHAWTNKMEQIKLHLNLSKICFENNQVINVTH